MYCTHCKTDTHVTERCWKLKKLAREKELSEKKSPYSKRTFCRKSMLLRAGRVRTAISKLSRELSSASRASTEKKKRNTQKWPVRKRLSLVTQTPLMSPLTSWNWVKEFLARRDMRSVQSDLTPGVIKPTSKILIQMMIAKCLLKSAVKKLKGR
jgi:predicted ATP-binding protein involved in virulence